MADYRCRKQKVISHEREQPRDEARRFRSDEEHDHAAGRSAGTALEDAGRRSAQGGGEDDAVVAGMGVGPAGLPHRRAPPGRDLKGSS